MKSDSLGTFKRKTYRRIKLWMIILTLFAGILTAAESRYLIFRIYNITIEPQNILSENVLWGTLKPLEEKIWPLYWIRSKSHEKFISDYYPINLNISLCGWGKFKVKCVPLEPKFKMFWGGKYWSVTNESRVWLTTLKENKYVSSSNAESIPVLSWSSDRKLPIDLSNKKGNVMDSNLPIERIEEWYNNIRTLDWIESIKYIQAEVRGDAPVVQVFFNEIGTKGVSILFSDNPADWYEPVLAVKKIYPNISTLSKDIFIDTTYKDKILVKNKVQLTK